MFVQKRKSIKTNFPTVTRVKVENYLISSSHKLELLLNAARYFSYQSHCNLVSLPDRRLAAVCLVLYSLNFSFRVHWSENTLFFQPCLSYCRQVASVPSNPRLSQCLDCSEKNGASSSSCLTVVLLWNRAEILSPYLESTQLSTYQTKSCILALWSSKMPDTLTAGQGLTSIFLPNALRKYTLNVFISALSLETTSNWNWLLVFIFLMINLGREYPAPWQTPILTLSPCLLCLMNVCL